MLVLTKLNWNLPSVVAVDFIQHIFEVGMVQSLVAVVIKATFSLTPFYCLTLFRSVIPVAWSGSVFFCVYEYDLTVSSLCPFVRFTYNMVHN